jgi:branched-chain amino acid transport system substrate-binding protein
VPGQVQPTEQRTFGRVIPSDEAQARAGAVWAKRLHSTGVTVVRGGTAYDKVIASAFHEEARAIGLRVATSGPSDLAYAAIEPSDPLGPLSAVPRVMGTDALLMAPIPKLLYGRHHRLLITSAAQDPSQLPAAGQRFVRDFRDRYGQPPGRYAAYGYEAMAVVLDSIRRAGENGADRDSVVSEFFDTANRHSVLGTHSIDDVGNTTLNRLAGYRDVHGRPVFDTPLRAPR